MTHNPKPDVTQERPVLKRCAKCGSLSYPIAATQDGSEEILAIATCAKMGEMPSNYVSYREVARVLGRAILEAVGDWK